MVLLILKVKDSCCNIQVTITWLLYCTRATMDSTIDDEGAALFVEKVRKMKFRLPPPKFPVKMPRIQIPVDVSEPKSSSTGDLLVKSISAVPLSPSSSTSENINSSCDSGICSEPISERSSLSTTECGSSNDDSEGKSSSSTAIGENLAVSENWLSPPSSSKCDSETVESEDLSGSLYEGCESAANDLKSSSKENEIKEEWEDYDASLRPIVYSAYIENKLKTWRSDWARPLEDRGNIRVTSIGRPHVANPKTGMFKFLNHNKLQEIVISRIPQAILDGTPIEIWDPIYYVNSVSAIPLSNVLGDILPAAASVAPTAASVAPTACRKRPSTTNGIVDSSKKPKVDDHNDKIVQSSSESSTTNEAVADNGSCTAEMPAPVRQDDYEEDDIVVLGEVKKQPIVVPAPQRVILQRARTTHMAALPPPRVIVGQDERKLIAHLSALIGNESVNLDDPQWFPKLMKLAETTKEEQDALIRRDRSVVSSLLIESKRLKAVRATYRSQMETDLVRRNIFSPEVIQQQMNRNRTVMTQPIRQSKPVGNTANDVRRMSFKRHPGQSVAASCGPIGFSPVPLPNGFDASKMSGYFNRFQSISNNPVGKIAYAPPRRSSVSYAYRIGGGVGNGLSAVSRPTEQPASSALANKDVIVLDDDAHNNGGPVDHSKMRSISPIRYTSISPLLQVNRINSTASTPAPTPPPSMCSPSISPRGSFARSQTIAPSQPPAPILTESGSGGERTMFMRGPNRMVVVSRKSSMIPTNFHPTLSVPPTAGSSNTGQPAPAPVTGTRPTSNTTFDLIELD